MNNANQELGLFHPNQEPGLFHTNVANIFTDGSEIRTAITTAPTGSMVAASPTLVVISSSVPMQMTLFGDLVVPQGGRKKRR
jgi:hypothetical protein